MRRESRGHTARIQRPYGQTPRVRRGHTARFRGHARAPVPHGHARATDWLNPAGGLTEPTGPDNIHVTKSPGTLPPRRARRVLFDLPGGENGYPFSPARQLCDHSALVPLPDRSTVLITLVRVNIAD